MIFGVTGEYCAGKDAAVRTLARSGIIEINEDKIGHGALRTLKTNVAGAFGEGVLREDGDIDRRALGAIVFGDLEALRRLESIVHPWMVEETRRQIAAAGNSHTMINAAILHRMGLHRLCDVVLIIKAPFLVRFLRAKKRDGHSFSETAKRLLTQRAQRQYIDIPYQFLNEKGAHVDTVVVKNGGSKSALAKRLRAFLSDHGITGRQL